MTTPGRASRSPCRASTCSDVAIWGDEGATWGSDGASTPSSANVPQSAQRPLRAWRRGRAACVGPHVPASTVPLLRVAEGMRSSPRGRWRALGGRGGRTPSTVPLSPHDAGTTMNEVRTDIACCAHRGVLDPRSCLRIRTSAARPDARSRNVPRDLVVRSAARALTPGFAAIAPVRRRARRWPRLRPGTMAISAAAQRRPVQLPSKRGEGTHRPT